MTHLYTSCPSFWFKVKLFCHNFFIGLENSFLATLQLLVSETSHWFGFTWECDSRPHSWKGLGRNRDFWSDCFFHVSLLRSVALSGLSPLLEESTVIQIVLLVGMQFLAGSFQHAFLLFTFQKFNVFGCEILQIHPEQNSYIYGAFPFPLNWDLLSRCFFG